MKSAFSKSILHKNNLKTRGGNIMMQNEKTVADKVLEQLEMRIDLIATKFMNGKSDRLESQKELEGIETICRDILNTLYPIAEEKTKSINELFMKTSELLRL